MLDPIDNQALLTSDRKFLESTTIPIVTVAASFRDELARFHGVDTYFGKDSDEVLFSRAHYSMALAALIGAWHGPTDPKRAWMVDPTNYVRSDDWSAIEFTEEVGKLLARHSLLKILKDLIDTRARQKLPITQAITTPLLFLFEHVNRPILSFHYEAGNILASLGKSVVQVVTDPHVRPQYLEYAHLSSVRYCVFDEQTRVGMLELASALGKDLNPRRVIVTGPPVDPRILAAARKKSSKDHQKRPLRLCIATGGLGTNQEEIVNILRSVCPLIRQGNTQILLYVGVHEDLRERVHQVAAQEGLHVQPDHETDAPMRVLYSPHIVPANEALIHYGFPWADGFVTKPSGDMAYDAAAAGCFLLTLEPWGEWEHNIRDVFEQRGIARRALVSEFAAQIESLSSPYGGKSFVETAIENALTLPDLFTHGIEKILAEFPRR